MKFSSSLEFNAVPEWRAQYIDYDSLKKLLYRLEKEAAVRPSGAEATQLLERDPEGVFVKALDTELEKIDLFYRQTEAKTFDKDDYVQRDIARFNDSETWEPDRAGSDTSDEENVPGTPATPRRRRHSSVSQHHQARKATYHRIQLKRDLVADYVGLNELISYIDLNRTGFRKALKKFDKILGTSLLHEYTSSKTDNAYVFKESTKTNVEERIKRVVRDYAVLVNDGSEEDAVNALKGYLREHIVWERNTVWRDMISLERQAQGVSAGAGAADAPQKKPLVVCGFTIPRRWRRVLPLAKVLGIFLIGSVFVIFPAFESPAQSNCLAIVVTASILWATEALPLFVTSLIVPVLVVVLRVPLTPKGKRMPANKASEFVFSKMWSPVITVLLGGFALAAALSKYNIAKALSTMVLTRAGSNPRIVVLTLMFVAAFMCMWISNVAAPVLLFSVAQPLLRTLPSGDPFGKAIILGIALASNVGGMVSPIASPQNVIALQNMSPEPSWLDWFAITIPVGIISIIIIWVMLIATFPSSSMTSLGHIRGHTDTFTAVHYYILAVTGFTITLWCFAHELEPYFGDMGILGFIPIVLLFGPGVLSTADFNNFLWTIIALAMGGITLGKAVESCGLLKTVAVAVQAQVNGLGLFSVCAVFGLMILFVASFISHTVAALIVLPLVRSIGEQMPEPHPNVVVMVSALMCSAAMALPTSGFPNVAAICMTNEVGTPYLTVGDFITRGVPASFATYLVIVTVGYLIMRWLGY